MANLFYGVCDSAQDADVKIIHRLPAEVDTDIEEGDLLVVYFAHGNTKASPQLSIDNLSDNQGLVVKKRDIQEDVSYMWKAGEVVGFVLVSQQANTDNNVSTEEGATSYETANDALYWELFEGGRATKEWYGMTKLFDVQDTMPPETWPDDVAATPALVEWVYNQIPKKEGRTITGIEYLTSWEGKQGNQQGKLVINYDTGNPDEYVITDNDTTYTNTSEFYNDANGNGAAGTNTDDGTYYITNTLNDDFYLTGNLYRDFPNSDPKGLITVSNSYVDYGSGFPDINAHVFGQNVYIGAQGKTSYAASDGSFRVPYGDIYEDGSQESNKLKNRYSPILTVMQKQTGNLTYDKSSQTPRGSDTAHLNLYIGETGWTPIGVVGWNISRIDSSVSSADAGYMNIWEAFVILNPGNNVQGPVVRFAMRNLDTNRERSANVTFHILYKKNL